MPTDSSNLRHELLSLEEVYGIEFGTRAMWKMTFANGPTKYNRSILAQSCTETSREIVYKGLPAGNWTCPVPRAQTPGTLNCTLYDDRLGTIENWARSWFATTNKDTTFKNLQYPTKYSTEALVYHYNMQYELIFARQYIVLPEGAISVSFNDQVQVSTISLKFRVFVYQDLENNK